MPSCATSGGARPRCTSGRARASPISPRPPGLLPRTCTATATRSRLSKRPGGPWAWCAEMSGLLSTVVGERQLSQLDGRFPAAMHLVRCLAPTLVMFFCACDGGGAVPDAATPKGRWRLVNRTASGITTQDASLDGALVLGDGEYALAIAAPPTGVITTYSLASTGKALQLGD